MQTGRSIVATETEKYVLSAGEVIIIPAKPGIGMALPMTRQVARFRSWSPANRISRRSSVTGPLTTLKGRYASGSLVVVMAIIQEDPMAVFAANDPLVVCQAPMLYGDPDTKVSWQGSLRLKSLRSDRTHPHFSGRYLAMTL